MKRLSVFSLALAVSVAACSKKDDDADAKTTRPPAGAAVAADPGRGGGPGGPAGQGGKRGGMTVTLSASDVATVVKMPIERSISITGDLRPLDRVDITARIDGDLDGVYVREGQRVGAGAVLAKFEAVEQESTQQSAEADRASAQTALKTAQWNLDQSQELYKQGAIPERDLRTAEQQLASARAQLAAADARMRATANALRDTRVTAPMAGIIEKRSVAPGEHVSRGAPLFTLVRNDVLELAATVPAAQAVGIKFGQTIRFTAANRLVIGRVSRISPTVDPVSRALTVYVQVPNPDGSLRGGTFATGKLVLSTEASAITIPSAAIRFSAQSNQPFVYRIMNGQLDNAQIQTGYSDETTGLVEVLSGLKPGDRIVVGNVGTLGKGMKVQILGGETNGPRGAR